jgi:hypothetical protein
MEEKREHRGFAITVSTRDDHAGGSTITLLIERVPKDGSAGTADPVRKPERYHSPILVRLQSERRWVAPSEPLTMRSALVILSETDPGGISLPSMWKYRNCSGELMFEDIELSWLRPEGPGWVRLRKFIMRPRPATNGRSTFMLESLTIQTNKADILRDFLLCRHMRKAWLPGTATNGGREPIRFPGCYSWLQNFNSSYFAAGTL